MKIWIMFFSLMFPILASAASFDCLKASSAFEKTICSNQALSGLDEKLAESYKSARASSQNPDQLKADQINWIKGARNCGADVSCIQNAYQVRIAALSSSKQSTPQPVQNQASGNKSKEAGTCFAAIATQQQRGVQPTPDALAFRDKYLPTFQKTLGLIKGECKGLGGTPALGTCLRNNLSKDEYDFSLGFTSGVDFINDPQDPNKLSNLGAAFSFCKGLVQRY